MPGKLGISRIGGEFVITEDAGRGQFKELPNLSFQTMEQAAKALKQQRLRRQLADVIKK